MKKANILEKNLAPPAGPETTSVATVTDTPTALVATIENHLQEAMDNHLEGWWEGTYLRLREALRLSQSLSHHFQSEVLAKRLADIGAMAQEQPQKANLATSPNTETQLALF